MTAEPQTYANHKRIDPWFHQAGLGLLLLALILAVRQLFLGRGAGQLVLALLLAVVLMLTRGYALRVQDRLIRLEETLRMQRLLPPELCLRIAELTPGQFVALRFASDPELAERMAEALQEHLRADAIKRRIQVWRPDTFRV
jgi:hypothetical protein